MFIEFNANYCDFLIIYKTHVRSRRRCYRLTGTIALVKVMQRPDVKVGMLKRNKCGVVIMNIIDYNYIIKMQMQFDIN